MTPVAESILRPGGRPLAPKINESEAESVADNARLTVSSSWFVCDPGLVRVTVMVPEDATVQVKVRLAVAIQFRQDSFARPL